MTPRRRPAKSPGAKPSGANPAAARLARAALRLLACALLAAVSPNAPAQPPVNDTCEERWQLNPRVIFFSQIHVNIAAATDDGFDTSLSEPGSPEVWYGLAPFETNVFRFFADSDFDAVIGIYRGSECGALETLGEFDFFEGPGELVDITLREGESYVFIVEALHADATGFFDFNFGLPDPSPGRLRGGLVASEALPDPSGGASEAGRPGFDTDGNGSAEPGDEFVELFNASDAPIDLAGLELWSPRDDAPWFVFPAGAELGPGQFAFAMAGVQPGGALPSLEPGNLGFDAGRPEGGRLDAAGDNVLVFDPAADAYLHVAFGGAPIVSAREVLGSAAAQRAGAIERWGPGRSGTSFARFPAADGPGAVLSEDVNPQALATPGGPTRVEAGPNTGALVR